MKQYTISIIQVFLMGLLEALYIIGTEAFTGVLAGKAYKLENILT